MLRLTPTSLYQCALERKTRERVSCGSCYGFAYFSSSSFAPRTLENRSSKSTDSLTTNRIY